MKKLIALLLALTLVFGLMACGAKKDAPVEEENPVVEETPEEEPVVEDEPAVMPDEPAVEDEPAVMPDEPAADEPAAMPDEPTADEPAAMPDEAPVEEEMPEIEYMPEEKLTELSALIDKLVANINDELMVGTMEITSDMYEYYGIPATEGIYAVVSMPMIGSIAHEVVLVELPEGVDAAGFAAEMEGLQNPMKWVCVQPETTWVKTSGNYVVAVMSSADMADAVAANFETEFGA